jgi:endonuclease/exonuclease/phosphatase family metal-dependent hydrolase
MELKVVSFNIRCCDDKDGHSISERAPRLKAVLDPIDADVIGFQECRHDWETILPRDYADKYEIYLVRRGDNESGPILWKKNKFRCIKNGLFWLSDTPETQSKGWDELFDCYRICMYAVLEDNETKERFCFMNTHYGFGDKGQIDSSNLIYKYSKKISDYPTFITGDFNMTPDSAGYKKITEYFTDSNAATLKYCGTTYHGYNPEDKKQHIDYCFVDDSVTPLSTTLLDQTFDGKYPSDHYGLYFKLKF